jgi:hypothetical protein
LETEEVVISKTAVICSGRGLYFNMIIVTTLKTIYFSSHRIIDPSAQHHESAAENDSTDLSK